MSGVRADDELTPAEFLWSLMVLICTASISPHGSEVAALMQRLDTAIREMIDDLPRSVIEAFPRPLVDALIEFEFIEAYSDLDDRGSDDVHTGGGA